MNFYQILIQPKPSKMELKDFIVIINTATYKTAKEAISSQMLFRYITLISTAVFEESLE